MSRSAILALALVAGLIPAGVAAQAESAEIRITLERESERERATADQLRRTLEEYDVDPWIFTRHVHIDERSIPHSHPVLTLHTRHLGNEHGLLAAFLHEQFHWLEEGNADFRAAMAAFAEAYPNAPAGGPEGARDLESTYRHLLVCDLEFQAMSLLVGERPAREVLSANGHYTWIYDRVLDDPRVREIAAAHGFLITGSGDSGVRRHDAMPVESRAGVARVDADSASMRADRFGRTVLPAVAGSYLGFLGGFYTMAAIADDSDTDFGTLVIAEGAGALVGATIASSVLAHELGAPADDARFGRSLGGALLGAVPGIVAASVVNGRYSAAYQVGIGWAIGQGVTTALIAAW